MRHGPFNFLGDTHTLPSGASKRTHTNASGLDLFIVETELAHIRANRQRWGCIKRYIVDLVGFYPVSLHKYCRCTEQWNCFWLQISQSVLWKRVCCPADLFCFYGILNLFRVGIDVMLNAACSLLPAIFYSADSFNFTHLAVSRPVCGEWSWISQMRFTAVISWCNKGGQNFLKHVCVRLVNGFIVWELDFVRTQLILFWYKNVFDGLKHLGRTK